MRTAMMVIGLILILGSFCHVRPEIRAVEFRVSYFAIMAIWNRGGGYRGLYATWVTGFGPEDGRVLWTTDGIRKFTGLW